MLDINSVRIINSQVIFNKNSQKFWPKVESLAENLSLLLEIKSDKIGVIRYFCFRSKIGILENRTFSQIRQPEGYSLRAIQFSLGSLNVYY